MIIRLDYGRSFLYFSLLYLCFFLVMEPILPQSTSRLSKLSRIKRKPSMAILHWETMSYEDVAYIEYTFGLLADTFIQSNLQMRPKIKPKHTINIEDTTKKCKQCASPERVSKTSDWPAWSVQLHYLATMNSRLICLILYLYVFTAIKCIVWVRASQQRRYFLTYLGPGFEPQFLQFTCRFPWAR